MKRARETPSATMMPRIVDDLVPVLARAFEACVLHGERKHRSVPRPGAFDIGDWVFHLGFANKCMARLSCVNRAWHAAVVKLRSGRRHDDGGDAWPGRGYAAPVKGTLAESYVRDDQIPMQEIMNTLNGHNDRFRRDYDGGYFSRHFNEWCHADNDTQERWPSHIRARRLIDFLRSVIARMTELAERRLLPATPSFYYMLAYVVETGYGADLWMHDKRQVPDGDDANDDDDRAVRDDPRVVTVDDVPALVELAVALAHGMHRVEQICPAATCSCGRLDGDDDDDDDDLEGREMVHRHKCTPGRGRGATNPWRARVVFPMAWCLASKMHAYDLAWELVRKSGVTYNDMAAMLMSSFRCGQLSGGVAGTNIHSHGYAFVWLADVLCELGGVRHISALPGHVSTRAFWTSLVANASSWGTSNDDTVYSDHVGYITLMHLAARGIPWCPAFTNVFFYFQWHDPIVYADAYRNAVVWICRAYRTDARFLEAIEESISQAEAREVRRMPLSSPDYYECPRLFNALWSLEPVRATICVERALLYAPDESIENVMRSLGATLIRETLRVVILPRAAVWRDRGHLVFLQRFWRIIAHLPPACIDLRGLVASVTEAPKPDVYLVWFYLVLAYAPAAHSPGAAIGMGLDDITRATLDEKNAGRCFQSMTVQAREEMIQALIRLHWETPTRCVNRECSMAGLGNCTFCTTMRSGRGIFESLKASPADAAVKASDETK